MGVEWGQTALVEVPDLAKINIRHAFKIINEYVFSVSMPHILHRHPVSYLTTLFTKFFFLFLFFFLPLFPYADYMNQSMGNAYNAAWGLPYLFLLLLKQPRCHGRTLKTSH